MIIDFKLTYPSGTATAHLINSFHTPLGAKLAKSVTLLTFIMLFYMNYVIIDILTRFWRFRKQVRTLGKFFSFSFLWGFFQWFFTAADDCGFVSFPTFGLKAYENRQANYPPYFYT